VGSSQINLAWTDNAGDETGVEIERCTGAGCGTFAPLTTVAANTTTYQNAGLPASTTYGYRVRAVKSELASAYSNEVSATTGATAPSAPSAPTGIAAAATSSSQIVVSWTDNSTDETAFRVERCTGAGCQSFAEVATLPAGATNYTNGGLTASTTYGYRVRAERSGVFSSYSATAAATTTAASAPAISLSATASKVKGTQKVALSWSGAANGTSGTVTITRTGAAEASFTVPNTGSYTDNIDRKGGGSYTYTVCEKDTPTRCSDSATVTF
jgi:titin